MTAIWTSRLAGAACFAVAAALSWPAQADEERLSKPEMLEILSGNTAIGTGEGPAWRQYFAPDGTTPYIVEGEETDVGRWEVTDDDLYRSWWESTGWTTYTMTGEGERVTWISEDGESRYPARIVEGRQIKE